jgi:hypothetical protein
MTTLRYVLCTTPIWLLVFACAPTAQSQPLEFETLYATGAPLLDASRELPDAVYEAEWVRGIYIRLVWAALEPQPHKYDFSMLDDELDKAVAAQKLVSISVITGARAPGWLSSAGIKTFDFKAAQGGGANRRCLTFRFGVPWDTAYQKALIDLQRAIAEHIRSKPGRWQAVRIVKLTGINQLTEELRFPMAWSDRLDDCNNPERAKTWSDLGYNPAAVVDTWLTIAKAIAAAFPDKILALDILERNDFPPDASGGEGGDPSSVKSTIIERAARLFPGRFAVQWNGLNLGGQTSNTILNAGRRGVIIGWQTNAFRGLAGAGCNPLRQGEVRACSLDEYRALLQRGISAGASYIEIWAPDALAFKTAVSDMQNELVSRKH